LVNPSDYQGLVLAFKFKDGSDVDAIWIDTYFELAITEEGKP